MFEKIKSINDCKVLLVGEGADEIYSGYKRMLYPYLLRIESEYGYDQIKEISSSFYQFMGIDEKAIIENFNKFKYKLNKETDYECQNFDRISLRRNQRFLMKDICL